MGLGLTIVGYVHSPKVAYSFRFPGLVGSSPASKEHRAPRTIDLKTSRHGLLRLVWGAFMTAFVTAELLLLTASGLAVSFGGTTAIAGGLLATGLPDNQQMWLMYGLFGFLSSFTGFMDTLDLRHLRVLPARTWRLSAILSAMAIVPWLGLWLSQIVNHLLFAGNFPASLRLELLALIIGASGLSTNLAGFRRRSAARTLVVLFLVPGGVGLYMYLSEVRGAAWILQLGILGLFAAAAAVFLNHRAVTGKSALYKPLPPFAWEPRSVGEIYREFCGGDIVNDACVSPETTDQEKGWSKVIPNEP